MKKQMIKKQLCINWKDYLGECEINDMWSRFRNKFQEAIKVFNGSGIARK